MNTVSGRVLGRPSMHGVPNLVVVAIDFDPARLGLDLGSDSNLSHGRGPATRDVDLLGLLRLHEIPWESVQPQRLGSVLTDRLGRFSLSFEDDLFRGSGTDASERRPDVVLFVLAPDTHGDDARGRSYEERVLFYTRPTRFEAGRTESYVITLDEEVLEERGIPVRRNGDGGGGGADGLRSILLAQSLEDEALRGVRSEHFGRIMLPRLTQVREATPTLLRATLPADIRDSSGFLGLRFTPEEALGRLRAGMLDWFDRHEAARASGRVYLSDDELDELGVDRSLLPGGAPLQFGDLLALLDYEAGPYRNRDLMTQVRARRAVAALSDTDADDGGAPGSGEDGDPPDISVTDFRQTILNRLGDQVSALERDRADAHPTSDLLRIKEIARQLELGGGIADATAIHDVNVLQIAFEPAWTAAFDRDFEADVRRLYRQTTELDATYGLTLSDVSTVDDLNQFRAFLADIEETGDYVADLEPVPPAILAVAPWLTGGMWNRLSDTGKSAVSSLVAGLHEVDDEFAEPPTWGIDSPERVAEASRRIREIVERHMTQPISRAEELALNLATRLSQPYSFHYFAPGTINYGLMLTYRQSWTPRSYQVGRLADALPLAPGETRTFTTRRRVVEKRARSSSRKTDLKRLDEATSVTRAEMEAMEKTSMAVSNQLTAQGSFNIGIGEIGVTNQFSMNQSRESQRLHKTFSEIARKSSEESRQEFQVEVEESTEEEFFSESVRRISNPNQELTVTYLLYELERRFRIASQLHAVQPVIVVALQMPAPHEINDAWILEHAWILRDVLLAEELEVGIDYVEQGRAQDRMQLELYEATYRKLHALVERAETEFERLADLARRGRDEVIALMNAEAGEAEDEASRVARGILSGGLSEIFGGGSDSDEILKARREAAEKALEYVESELSGAAEARAKATSDLQAAADRYGEALTEQAAKDQAVAQLQLHIRGHIHYYQHEIWRRMDHDRLFFSLYDKEVPFLDPMEGTCRVRPATPEEVEEEVPGVRIDGDLYVVEITSPDPPPDFDSLPRRRLVEVADLDRPLGFRGNYAIFPLRTSSYLTDFMLVGFLDSYFGIRDPAMDSAWTSSELLDYAREVWEDPVMELDDEDRERLARMIVEGSVRSPGNEVEVVLPTGQLFMEALKGDQALLESFKLAHRGLDVVAVEQDVLRSRLENLRLAQRIGMEEPELDDPDADKVIVVRGDADITVTDE